MKIGIATCLEKPLPTASDEHLVRELRRRGHDVLPVVWNSTNQANVDVMLIRSTWDYHKFPKQFLDWIHQLEKKSVRVMNSSGTIQWNLDKSYLFSLKEEGVSIVPSILCPQNAAPTEALKKIQKEGWLQIVLKPTISATSFLTFKSTVTSPELLHQIEQVHQQSDLLVQPFLPSIVDQGEVSLIFFNDDEPRYSHAVLKLPIRGDYRVQGDFGGTVVLFEATEDLIHFGRNCLSNLQSGWIYARVDVVDWQKKPLLGELEMIEPDLFMDLFPDAAFSFADSFFKRMNL